MTYARAHRWVNAKFVSFLGLYEAPIFSTDPKTRKIED